MNILCNDTYVLYNESSLVQPIRDKVWESPDKWVKDRPMIYKRIRAIKHVRESR